MTVRNFVRLSISIILLIAFGCTKSPDTIKIGVSGPMTGAEARMGEDFKNGARLAVDEWNEKGGLLGKKIELVIEDDQSDPKQAVSVANRHVNAKVIGVIGHFDSSCSIPASDVYNRAGIPVISPASTNPQLTEKGYRNSFRVCGRDDQQGKVGAEYVVTQLKLKNVAVIHDKSTYGQGLADEFKKNLGDKVNVVYYGGVARGDKDFKTVLTAIKEKKPELIFFGGVYAEGGLIVRQAREIGLKVPFMSGDGVFVKEFINIAGKEAVEGSYITFSPDPANIPSAKGFIDKFKPKYGDMGAYSIYAYDATNILLASIKDIGTADGAKVVEKLHASEYPGALGKIKFNDKGDVTTVPYVIWTVTNGEFKEKWKP